MLLGFFLGYSCKRLFKLLGFFKLGVANAILGTVVTWAQLFGTVNWGTNGTMQRRNFFGRFSSNDLSRSIMWFYLNVL